MCWQKLRPIERALLVGVLQGDPDEGMLFDCPESGSRWKIIGFGICYFPSHVDRFKSRAIEFGLIEGASTSLKIGELMIEVNESDTQYL